LLRAAAEAIESGLPVEIACVFCNRERGEDPNSDEFLALADSFGFSVVGLSSARFRKAHGGPVARKGEPLPAWRLAYDDEALRLLAPFDFNVGVLAGYMLIFGPRACAALTLLNLHPAAPGGPIGIWQDVIWQLIEQRAERSGITIFKAEPAVDTGPPLAYCTYPLRDEAMQPLWRELDRTPLIQLREEQGEQLPLFAEIRRRGVLREPPLILETLSALASNGVEALLGHPLDLTPAVERRLRS
jgi:folate-dependent phosphoribosylglycinamide formyltransferase PurN